MSTFERIDGIIRQKRFEGQCMLKIEQMKSEENIRRLREVRAIIEEKMRGR